MTVWEEERDGPLWKWLHICSCAVQVYAARNSPVASEYGYSTGYRNLCHPRIHTDVEMRERCWLRSLIPRCWRGCGSIQHFRTDAKRNHRDEADIRDD